MRRPITSALLLLFLLASLYLARPASPETVLSPLAARWLPVPTVVVHQGHDTYLVATTAAWLVSGSGRPPRVVPLELNWVEIPEPSGAGVWRLAQTKSGRTLFGLGGPVFPSPTGEQTLLLDPGSHRLYSLTASPTGATPPISPLATGIQISQVRWSREGTFVVAFGVGERGAGLYRWTGRTAPTWIGPVSDPVLALAALPHPVAVTEHGTVDWLHHGVYPLNLTMPAVSSAGTVLGFRDARAVWWQSGRATDMAVPALPLVTPRFSPDGNQAAYIAQVGRDTDVLVVSAHGVHTLPAPGPNSVVAGWIGRDVVVSVLAGPNEGTYLLSS